MTNMDIENAAREILGGNTKSANAKATVIMARAIDKLSDNLLESQAQFSRDLLKYQKEVDARMLNQQKTVEARMLKLEMKTDKKFSSLKVFSFMGENRWLAIMIVVAFIVIMIWAVKLEDPKIIKSII